MSEAWTKTNYRFVKAIAEGGMGRVEMVVRRSGQFQRVYAMKRLKPAARDDAVETAKRSRFRPAIKEGVAGRMWTTIPIVLEAE